MEIPRQHYGQLKSRSGLCVKHQLNVNAVVIDSDFCGKIEVVLANEPDKDYKI